MATAARVCHGQYSFVTPEGSRFHLPPSTFLGTFQLTHHVERRRRSINSAKLQAVQVQSRPGIKNAKEEEETGAGGPGSSKGTLTLPGTANLSESRLKDSKTVFVAGSTGRVGSRTVRELLKRGFRVRAATRNVEKAEAVFQDVLQAANTWEEPRAAMPLAFLDPAKLFRFLKPKPDKQLDIIECDLESPIESIEMALENAGIVLCCIGASEKEVLDITGPYRIDFKATKNLIDAASEVQVNHFVLLTSLGTQKFGLPAAVLNLFWGVLLWKAKAEKALIASKLPYTIVRPGGMERPTDAYKETHNLFLAKADTLFGGQVSNLQVAELIACAVDNLALSKNKILEVIAETTAPLRPIEELLREIPSSDEEERPKIKIPSATIPRLSEVDGGTEKLLKKKEEQKSASKKQAENQITKEEKRKQEMLKLKYEREILTAKEQEAEAQRAMEITLTEKAELEKKVTDIREKAEAAALAARQAKALEAAILSAAKKSQVLAESEKQKVLNSVKLEAEKVAQEVTAPAKKSKAQFPFFEKRMTQQEEKLESKEITSADIVKDKQVQSKQKEAEPKEVKEQIKATSIAQDQQERKQEKEELDKKKATSQEAAKATIKVKVKGEQERAEQEAKAEQETTKLREPRREEQQEVTTEAKLALGPAQQVGQEQAITEVEAPAVSRKSFRWFWQPQTDDAELSKSELNVPTDISSTGTKTDGYVGEKPSIAQDQQERKREKEELDKKKATSQEAAKATIEVKVKGKQERAEQEVKAAQETTKLREPRKEDQQEVTIEAKLALGPAQRVGQEAAKTEVESPAVSRKSFRWFWQPQTDDAESSESELTVPTDISSTGTKTDGYVGEKPTEVPPSSTPRFPGLKAPSSLSSSPPQLAGMTTTSAQGITGSSKTTSFVTGLMTTSTDKNPVLVRDDKKQEIKAERKLGEETAKREVEALEKAKMAPAFIWPWQKPKTTTDEPLEGLEEESTQTVSESSRPLSPYTMFPGLKPPSSPTPSIPVLHAKAMPTAGEPFDMINSQKLVESTNNEASKDMEMKKYENNTEARRFLAFEVAQREQEALKRAKAATAIFWPWQKRKATADVPPEVTPPVKSTDGNQATATGRIKEESALSISESSRPLSPYIMFPGLKPPSSPTPSTSVLPAKAMLATEEPVVLVNSQQPVRSAKNETCKDAEMETSRNHSEARRLIALEAAQREQEALIKAKAATAFLWPWQRKITTNEDIETPAEESIDGNQISTTANSRPLSPYTMFPGMKPPSSPNPAAPALSAKVMAATEEALDLVNSQEPVESTTNEMRKDAKMQEYEEDTDTKRSFALEVAQREREALEKAKATSSFMWPWQNSSRGEGFVKSSAVLKVKTKPATPSSNEFMKSEGEALPRSSRPLSPYANYPDLKPPSSPAPSPPVWPPRASCPPLSRALDTKEETISSSTPFSP